MMIFHNMQIVSIPEHIIYIYIYRHTLTRGRSMVVYGAAAPEYMQMMMVNRNLFELSQQRGL